MKFSKIFFFLCIATLFFCAENSQAQTRKQLEAKRKKIEQEIVQVNKLLFTAQKNEKNALEALEDINQKIATRTNYILLIQKESSLLSVEINENQKQISKLSTALELLKKDYADMIFKSYKSKSKQSQLLFIMSSKSFQQAYKRLQYMKQYARFRKKQGEQINIQSYNIAKFNDSLLYKKQVKDTLIEVEEFEKKEIEIDKEDKEKLVSQIKRKESTYKRQIRAKQREERKIADKIDAIIKAAIARSNKRNKGNTSAKGFSLTPEAKALGMRFEENKGKLPWPIKNGLIVRKFGRQAHPTISGILISSSGLHIATDKGAIAKSVFNGKVLAIQVLSGGKKAVLIQHGNYITTYTNLENLLVKKGDVITTGEVLGKVFTNKVTRKTILIFVVHKETERQNPANWILKR
jgi:septal ring factor EnvC (AmiA/AmiB activator)